jgi:ribonuclease BN (tRNA processing enzyme)
MQNIIVLVLSFGLCLFSLPVLAEAPCSKQGIVLQVLGSGGPEINDQRASTSYLFWQDGHARVLIDVGGGSMLRLEQSGADINDLDIILLTHLHVDHSGDLPYLIKATYFTGRDRDLPIYGPTGNVLMPSTTGFLQTLFGPQGAFRYLQEYVDGTGSYRLLPKDVDATTKTQQVIANNQDYKISAVAVHHGPIPALAWRMTLAGKTIVFSGDMNGEYHTLETLAANADLLVAHNAVPEDARGTARDLHMPPSVIGKIAAQAKVKQLVLSHRMQRTLGREQETLKFIRQHYPGPVQFADDLQCFRP